MGSTSKKTRRLKPIRDKGDTGKTGATGATGERGATGKTGPASSGERFGLAILLVIIVSLIGSNVLAFKTNGETADQADEIQVQADKNTHLNNLQNILFCDVAIILAESPPAQGPAPGQSAKSFKRQVKAAVGVVATAEQLDCKDVVTKARAERDPAVVNEALKEVGLEPDAPAFDRPMLAPKQTKPAGKGGGMKPGPFPTSPQPGEPTTPTPPTPPTPAVPVEPPPAAVDPTATLCATLNAQGVAVPMVCR